MPILYLKTSLECPHCEKEIPVRTVHLDYVPHHSKHDETVLTEQKYQELREKRIIEII